MPHGLQRYYGLGHVHYLTCSCYHREPWLASPRRRDLFIKILEQTRQSYRFVVAGYVVMPAHSPSISDPERGTPSTIMQVLKQRFARCVLDQPRDSRQAALWPEDKARVWQRRFYDFNVWSAEKRIEKLRYMHENPVKRRLVLEAGQWEWSSFRSYSARTMGKVKINDWPEAILKVEPAAQARLRVELGSLSPPLQKAQGWATRPPE